tara:strand:+ start:10750 stop:11139 length:390 start_codon:yes stop_codon:yes gene_type:complete
MSTKEIITDISINDFKTLLNNIPNKIIILKFTADWCKPCHKIKTYVNDWFNKLPDNFIIIEIDIDETMDLYYKLKTKKMVNGIPSILAYYGNTQRDMDKWFIPSDSVVGGNVDEINLFFTRSQLKGASM